MPSEGIYIQNITKLAIFWLQRKDFLPEIDANGGVWGWCGIL